jgi:hypothetical protein
MTDTPPPTRTRVDAANAARQRTAATKAADNIVRRLRHLADAKLDKLIEAAQFEQLIRGQARTSAVDVARETPDRMET